MKLPNDAKQKADAVQGLSDQRKQEILTHWQGVTESRRRAEISHFMTQGSETERKLAMAVFGKEAIEAGASPANKAVIPPTTL